MDETSGNAASYKNTGDESAFEAVLSACEPLIARYSYWLGADRTDAAQDLRICVVEAIRDWDGQRPFMAFCGTVLYRNAVNLLERQRRQARLTVHSLDAGTSDEDEGELSWHEVVADPKAADPGAVLERDDDAKKALKILDMHGIPRRKRRAFMLAVIEGMTYKQASKKMRCNVKRVDNNLQHARKILRHDHEKEKRS